MSGSLTVVVQKHTGCVLAALTRASGKKPENDAEKASELASLVGTRVVVLKPVATDFKPPTVAGHVSVGQLALEVVDSSSDDAQVVFDPGTFHVERSDPKAPAKLIANDPAQKKQCKISPITSTSVTVGLVSGPAPDRDLEAWLHIEDTSGNLVYEKNLTWRKNAATLTFDGMNLPTSADYLLIAMLAEHLPALDKQSL